MLFFGVVCDDFAYLMAELIKVLAKLPVFSGKEDGWHSWKRRLFAVLDEAKLLNGLTEDRDLMVHRKVLLKRLWKPPVRLKKLGTGGI